MSGHDNEDLIDYEDEHDIPTVTATSTTNGGATGGDEGEKKNFSSIHSTGFRCVPLFTSKICSDPPAGIFF